MFGTYDISMAEATHVKNYLLKHKYVSAQAKFFGNLLEKDLDKEFALDFTQEYHESITLGPTGTGNNTQRNQALFTKARLRLILSKNKKIDVTLTVDYLFSTLENGPGVQREGTLMYHADIPIDKLFKI